MCVAILERIDFLEFQLWEGMEILRALTCKSFYLRICMVILKELIFNSFSMVLEELIFKRSNFRGGGDLERTDC